MNIDAAKNLVTRVLKNAYDEENFRELVHNLFDNYTPLQEHPVSGAYIWDSFKEHIISYKRLAKYETNGQTVDVLAVCVQNGSKLEHARTMLRNFISKYLNAGRGGKLRDAALVAFYAPDSTDWRLSLVKMDYNYDVNKQKIENVFTPARRYSFLVGTNEQVHTACKQFLDVLVTGGNPTLHELEKIFSIETVSNEFFEKYKELFLRLAESIDNIRQKDIRINSDFELNNITTQLFCKKLLGQIVFLYFLQKKGWLGVDKDQPWGTGRKDFLRSLFTKAVNNGENYFDAYLEHLFYEALAIKRPDSYFERLGCRIPFLNGGLFEPIQGYKWDEYKIMIPNDIFSNSNSTKEGDIGDGILDVFDRYNFTVREDEMLEKEVAVDPEMLGKVFENLLEVNDRKSKGAFYTPREIVHFMCQESLINYLYNKVNCVQKELAQDQQPSFCVFPKQQLTLAEDICEERVSKQALSDFIRYGDIFREHERASGKNNTGTYEHKIAPEIKKYAEEIDQALADVLVLDPAIGSGAFPVGMMNEIVRARLNLLEYGYICCKGDIRNSYTYKRHAIEHSLYGVDIEDSAVEIAKLRFWLSLVVDESTSDKINPLPNLDYKIRCANSLVSISNQGQLFENKFKQLSELENLKKEYINTSDGRIKRGLKTQIDQILVNLSKGKEFDYEIFFSEVFHINRGFDIVIGNPPYVGEKGHKELFEPIKPCRLGRFYQGKMDLFYFFFHLALDLLKPNGVATFITTNYYITATGGTKLRTDLKNRAILLHLINFNELKIFKSATGQHNMITMLQKMSVFSKQQDCECCVTSKTGFASPKELQDIVIGLDPDTQYSSISQDKLYDGPENYIRLQQDDGNNPVIAILNKIQTGNKQLAEIANVNTGIMGGCDFINKSNSKYATEIEMAQNDIQIGDGVFILDKNNQRDIAAITQFDGTTILKDFYKNSDISKYITSNHSTKYIVFSADTNTEAEKNVIKHNLDKYKKILTGIRQINGEKLDNWYLLRRGASHPTIFNGPKIVAPQRSARNTFGYNEIPWYASADVYFITSPKQGYSLKYILGLLNSKLYYFWLYHKGKRKGETLELYQKPLSEIPIKHVSELEMQTIEKLVDSIITNANSGLDTMNLENKLNAKIYDIYNISLTEQSIIEEIQ